MHTIQKRQKARPSLKHLLKRLQEIAPNPEVGHHLLAKEKGSGRKAKIGQVAIKAELEESLLREKQIDLFADFGCRTNDKMVTAATTGTLQSVNFSKREHEQPRSQERLTMFKPSCRVYVTSRTTSAKTASRQPQDRL